MWIIALDYNTGSGTIDGELLSKYYRFITCTIFPSIWLTN